MEMSPRSSIISSLPASPEGVNLERWAQPLPLAADTNSEQWSERPLFTSAPVTRPPSAVTPMNLRRDRTGAVTPLLSEGTTYESFPMRRDNQPNYQKLAKGYYRLYQRNGQPIQSDQRIHADDPSLSEFAFEHVPPPATASSLRYFVSARERIHPSRMRVFLPLDASAGASPLRVMRPASGALPLSLDRPNDETWFFRIEVSMDEDEGRDEVQLPQRVTNRTGQGIEQCCEEWDQSCRACCMGTPDYVGIRCKAGRQFCIDHHGWILCGVAIVVCAAGSGATLWQIVLCCKS